MGMGAAGLGGVAAVAAARGLAAEVPRRPKSLAADPGELEVGVGISATSERMTCVSSQLDCERRAE